MTLKMMEELKKVGRRQCTKLFQKRTVLVHRMCRYAAIFIWIQETIRLNSRNYVKRMIHWFRLVKPFHPTGTLVDVIPKLIVVYTNGKFKFHLHFMVWEYKVPKSLSIRATRNIPKNAKNFRMWASSRTTIFISSFLYQVRNALKL